MTGIEVAILDQHPTPDATMMFLAKLTQRGHKITTMEDLLRLQRSCDEARNKEFYSGKAAKHSELIASVAELPHGTIKRFTPITVAIVGASRRFLAQIRTHQVGFTFVSASLQYSNYTDRAQFVVPYSMMGTAAESEYLVACKKAMETYKELIEYRKVPHDEAAYVIPQGLRNILIMQGNHQAWEYLIRLRACRRNTDETRYVVTRIWELLLESNCGEELFGPVSPPCIGGKCPEGKMKCGKPFRYDNANPSEILRNDWPLLYKED